MTKTNFTQATVTSEYKETTIILFDELFDGNIYYYVGIYHNYNDLKKRELVRMTEFMSRNNALNAYKKLITVIEYI